MTMTQASASIRGQMGRIFVGQDEFVRHMLICLFSGGHVLIEGVPGLGKTLAVRALAQSVGVEFKRIQFTPDLMPSDIIGASIFDLSTHAFHLKRGPLFTQFLLADEINRTPPKTQSALLEAMEENRVSIDGQDYPLAQPFMVFATQNPVEYEGTYPLPEAQLDRFMMKLTVGYPTRPEEHAVLRNTHAGFHPRDFERLNPVVDAAGILAARREAGGVRVDDSLFGYILDIVEATRRNHYILLGGSPRASIALLQTAKAAALLEGRDFVIPEDIQSLVTPVLRHRIILTPDAEIEGATADRLLAQILSEARVPR
ncbi:MAG: MoxR family ATPase [Oscillospiraceae bacterium]|jgi:MoxR-like ATPase|nr:MoxR family ATPase [Oscillospiraceae bacterium]